MSAPLGKLDPERFAAVIAPHLGATRDDVRVGPGPGRDVGILDVAEGRVMAITVDPLSLVPGLGPEDSAWSSLHLLVNDLVTSGLGPSHLAVSLDLPPELDDAAFEAYWRALHAECERLDIAIVAGHTGRYGEIGAASGTLIGSGTLVGFGPDDAYLVPDFAQPGDRLIVTRGAMAATTGVLAQAFPETVRRTYGSAFAERAQACLGHYPVIDDAWAALEAGRRDAGVAALHDATEGGVLGALAELARAAGCGMRVAPDHVPVSAEARAIAELFGLDPLVTLSEGALLVAARPDRADAVLASLERGGIPAADVGELTEPDSGLTLVADERARSWTPPPADPYWHAYERAVARGWR